MFETLAKLTAKPALFASFDTGALWTDPHVSEMMLTCHLDETSALASRPAGQIDAMVHWLDRHLGLAGKSLTDLGCGPGLYAARFHKAGARVTGIDQSERSIAYAKAQGLPNTDFRVGDYNMGAVPPADIVTLIYGDVCAMPRDRRASLFQRIHSALPAGGVFVLDAFAASCFDAFTEAVVVAADLDGGFWAPPPYFGLKATFLYPDATTVLDRYLIVEKERSRWVHNWMQYMTPGQLSSELMAAGFEVGGALDVLTGDTWRDDQDMFCLLATKI